MFLELRPDNIYHLTVMPCYDKKLEASRSDFYNDIYRTRDVDCVLTSGELNFVLLMNFNDYHLIMYNTGEVIDMVEEKGIDFLSLPDTLTMDGPYVTLETNHFIHSIVHSLYPTCMAQVIK